MIEVAGTFNTAICYTGELEPVAGEQIKTVCDRREFADCKIRKTGQILILSRFAA